MCKQTSDDEIKNSEMIKPKEAMFYFNNEKEEGDDSSGSCEEDELDEGIMKKDHIFSFRCISNIKEP